MESWSSLSLIKGSYFNKKLWKDKFQFWWLHHKIGCWQFLKDFVSGVERRGKDIKIKLTSLGLHAGRFTVDVQHIETRYFYILTFSFTFHRILRSSNFYLHFIKFYFGFKALGSLVCSFTLALLILVWLSFEEKFFSSNPRFESNPPCSKLFCF